MMVSNGGVAQMCSFGVATFHETALVMCAAFEPKASSFFYCIPNIFQFPTLPGEMIQFDSYFSNGLKPAFREALVMTYNCGGHSSQSLFFEASSNPQFTLVA